MRWSKSDLPVDLVPRHKVIDPKRDQRPHQPCQQGIAVFTDHAHFSRARRDGWPSRRCRWISRWRRHLSFPMPE
jgi:hypothetical protein